MDLKKKKEVVVIACGGTGGHIAPGLGLGEYWLKKKTEDKIIYLLNDKKISRRFLSNIPSGAQCISIPEINFRKISKIFHNIQAVFSILLIIRRLKIKNIKYFFSTGSGAGVIPGLIVRCFGVPLFLLEQNALMGKANLFLSLFAKKIYLTIPLYKKVKRLDEKCVLSGNPMPAYSIINNENKRNELSFKNKKPVILVMGGSQGAKSLNHKALEIFAVLKKNGCEFNVIHLTGNNDQEEIRKKYIDLSIDCWQHAFCHNMAHLYAISSLAVSRAGAGSISELSYWGLPSVLLPYPYAAEDHQYYNGKYIAAYKGALMFRENEFNAAKAATWIKSSLDDENILRQRKQCIKKALIDNAVEVIFKDLDEL